MNKTYCSECGHKMIYEVAKPKYCSECTHPLGGAPTVARQKPRPVVVNNDDDDDDDDDYYDDEPQIPRLSNIRLNVDITNPRDNAAIVGHAVASNVGVNHDRQDGRRKHSSKALRKRVKSEEPIDL